ncbi:hypothetical protein [Desulfovibrio ferrophilus]|uniref:Uncharacterized protein n=1 Tax=Desulfovibrio ferrophilus TaxID=241368 RepID=A0A2Z6B1X6_9BACT|nr:hypothetical protein [Desulfovibrio ferrophilus]BBD09448.1 hypothetical protein DFE_2722 [Desulfovibrio ferrophilus]
MPQDDPPLFITFIVYQAPSVMDCGAFLIWKGEMNYIGGIAVFCAKYTDGFSVGDFAGDRLRGTNIVELPQVSCFA